MKRAAVGTNSGAHFHRPLLLVSRLCAVALAALTVVVYINPVIPLDAGIARAVQSVPVGPLSPIPEFFRQIGGPYAVVAEAVVFATILALHRASWRFYAGAHWPTDVLAGLLIGVGWLSSVLSVRWISDPVLEPRARPRDEQKEQQQAA